MKILRHFACCLAIIALVAGCSKSEHAAESPAPEQHAELATAVDSEQAVVQETFPSADAGVEALVEALRAPDRPALTAMFGKSVDEIVPDDEVDRADVEKFLAAYDSAHRLIRKSDSARLIVGTDEWAFPIPLIKDGDSWRFDMVAGEDEMTIRRIGRNELAVIQTCLAYYDAQKEYASKDHNGDGILEYAQKIMSSEGQRDGLFWPGEGDDISPLGPLLADDVVAGEPYHGYRYRILTAQGPNATRGARSYLIGNRMTGGFGLVAWPAEYNYTGIMTFIVNHDGKVFEKDLGEDTEIAVAAVTAFNPDDTWKEVKPQS